MLVAFEPPVVSAVPALPQNALKAVVNVAAPSTIAHETKPMSRAYSTPSWPASSRKNVLSTFMTNSPLYVRHVAFVPAFVTALPPSLQKPCKAVVHIAAPPATAPEPLTMRQP